MKQVKPHMKTPSFLSHFSNLVLLALLVIFMSCNNNNSNKDEENTADMMDVKGNNSTVTDYISFIQSDTNKMSLDHAYTNEALLKLTAATSAMADATGIDAKGDLEKVRGYAGNITKNPYETSHADDIRKAADILSNVLQNIQQAKYTGLATEANEVKTAAMAIDPDVLRLTKEKR